MRYEPVRNVVVSMVESELRTLAAGSGVSHAAVAKIRYSQTHDPRISTVEKLSRFLFDSEDGRDLVAHVEHRLRARILT